MSQISLSFLKQTVDGILVHVNSINQNCKEIHWQKSSANKHCSSQIYSDTMELTNFPEGSGAYTFWTVDKDGNESDTVRVYVALEDFEYVKEKIYNGMTNHTDVIFIKDELEKLQKKITPKKYATDILADLYEAIKNPEEYQTKSLQELIIASEHYENSAALGLNSKLTNSIKLEYGPQYALSVTPTIDRIESIRVDETGQEYLENVIAPSSKVKNIINFAESSHYLIRLYNENDMVCQLVHYQFDEVGQTRALDIEKSSTSIDQYFIDEAMITKTGIEFLSNEKEKYVFEKSIEPISPIVARPILSQGNKVLNYDVNDKILLDAIGGTYYLALCEESFYSPSDINHIKLTKGHGQIDISKYYFENEVIGYVEDNKRKPVSRIIRFFIGSGEDNDITESDYVEKRNLYELAEYKNQLTRAINKNTTDTELKSYILKCLDLVYQDEKTTIDNVSRRLICKCAQDPYFWRIRNNVIYFIMSNWLAGTCYSESFFAGTSPVRYSNPTALFSWPPHSKDYALIVESFNVGDDEPLCQYYPSSGTTINVNTGEKDFYILHAIERGTYIRSGFILVCNDKKYEGVWTGSLGMEEY